MAATGEIRACRVQWPGAGRVFGVAVKVLVACERSGMVRRAFERAGHLAVSCDMEPADDDGNHHQGDVIPLLGMGWDLLIAHPPCTRLTNSGVRWLIEPPKGKTLAQMWQDLREGAAFYRALRDAPIKRKAIENPIMHKHARALVEPGYRQVVQPWWFGDRAFKATGLELIGLPDLVATDKLTPPKAGTDEHKRWSMIHRAPPGPNRARERSNTFPGLAQAMADQWGDLARLAVAA